jgi:hypothetical protein
VGFEGPHHPQSAATGAHSCCVNVVAVAAQVGGAACTAAGVADAAAAVRRLLPTAVPARLLLPALASHLPLALVTTHLSECTAATCDRCACADMLAPCGIQHLTAATGVAFSIVSLAACTAHRSTLHGAAAGHRGGPAVAPEARRCHPARRGSLPAAAAGAGRAPDICCDLQP